MLQIFPSPYGSIRAMNPCQMKLGPPNDKPPVIPETTPINVPAAKLSIIEGPDPVSPPHELPNKKPSVPQPMNPALKTEYAFSKAYLMLYFL